MNVGEILGTRTIVTTSPAWNLSGVHTFVENFFAELASRGWRCHAVITQPGREGFEPPAALKSVATVKCLPSFTGGANLIKRQSALRRFLIRHAPCVYLPNFDFEAAGITPALPPEVITVATLHSDEACYYDFVRRHGTWIDGFAAVSRRISENLSDRVPQVADRVAVIPCGIPSGPGTPTRSETPARPLRIAYCGRIVEYQKRVMDLAQVINICSGEALPVRFTIVGGGPDESRFKEAIAASRHIVRFAGTIPNHEVRRLLETDVDVIVLTSEFEGLPVIMLEAMDAGCVPVVTNIESGIREVVRDGVNGILLPVGDVRAFASAFSGLAANRSRLAQLSEQARRTVRSAPFTITSTADAYEALFAACEKRRDRGDWHREPGSPIIPDEIRLAPRVRRRIRSVLSRLIDRQRA